MGMLDETLLTKYVRIHYKQNWVGDPPHWVDDTNHISGVTLRFPLKVWWDMATRDGSHYVGGCCGAMSAMQDLINGAFRDSGYLSSAALLELGEIASAHEGFEGWGKKVTSKQFKAHLAKWSELEPSNPEDAKIVHDGWCGNPTESNPEDWDRLSDKKPFKITLDEAGMQAETRTCAEWIALKGRGFCV